VKYFSIKQGKDVVTVCSPLEADVPSGYRPGGKWAFLTEIALRSVDLRSAEKWILHTQKYENQLFNERVVPREGREVRWEIAAAHRNKENRQPSPFVYLPQPIKSPYLTLELVRRGNRWMLDRLYHGENYVPPLPWRKSAKSAPGGMAECKKYWSDHAFTYQENFVLGRRPFEQLDRTPPEWARQLGW
jgi:hypothetical protein